MMQLSIYFFLNVFCWKFGFTRANADPCVSYSNLPRAAYRGGKCPMVFGKEVCDSTTTTDWYRATGTNGENLRIQTTPADFEKCGTKYPIWMNGTHPSVPDNEVTRNICRTDLVNTDCSGMILVKNCSGFYVYKLSPTPSCPIGYCFAEQNTCPPFDPCDVYEHQPFKSGRGRSINCNSVRDTCDQFTNNTWYKVRDLAFSTLCPNITGACGAPLSLWINKTMNMSSSEKSHVICVNDGSNCCSSTRTIQSKDCGDFSVYNFGNLPSSPCQRICTDTKGYCPTTTKSLVTSTTTPDISTTDHQKHQPSKTVSTTEVDGASKKEGKGKTDVSKYLWISGLIAGVIIGGMIGALVVVRLIKFRGKKVSDSTLISDSEVPTPVKNIDKEKM